MDHFFLPWSFLKSYAPCFGCYIPSKNQLCFMIDAGKYFIHSAHSGMCLFLLHDSFPFVPPFQPRFHLSLNGLFSYVFGGQETNAILFDAFDLIRSARPTASSDFAVFQCESFDQDVTEGVSKIHVFLGGGVGFGEQGWRVLCVCIMENPQPSFFVVLHLYHLISYIHGFGVHGPRVYSGYKSVQDPLVMLSHPKIFGEQKWFANLKVKN